MVDNHTQTSCTAGVLACPFTALSDSLAVIGAARIDLGRKSVMFEMARVGQTESEIYWVIEGNFRNRRQRGLILVARVRARGGQRGLFAGISVVRNDRHLGLGLVYGFAPPPRSLGKTFALVASPAALFGTSTIVGMWLAARVSPNQWRKTAWRDWF